MVQLETKSEGPQKSSVNEIIALARAAQTEWAKLSLGERLTQLENVASRLQELKASLIESIHTETSKPLPWAEAEVEFCIGSIEAHQLEFEMAFSSSRVEDSTGISEVHSRPLGVVAVFSPFNSTLECSMLGLLPALAAGNSVILKSSEFAPRTAEIFVSAFDVCPVLNLIQVLHGDANSGDQLVRGAIEMVVFTGSAAVGRKIAAAASPRLKRVILELGGKDPLIVFADSDLSAAVETAIQGAFGFAGQVCTASEQVWVEAPLMNQFRELVTKRINEMIANGESQKLISPTSRERVLGLIDDAVKKGARLICGGLPSQSDLQSLQPVLLEGVKPEMRIAREEIFGPVMSIAHFHSIEEIVEYYRDSEHALGATILTEDTERAQELASLLPHAMIGINRGCIGVQSTPWFGARQSGLGILGSIEGHRQFVSMQVITRDHLKR